MFALFNILKFTPDKEDKQESYIYKSALLGAIGSLFTALEQNSVFADVLNNQFKKQFRNMAFHFCHLILEREPVVRLKLVFTHFYEHCRNELAAHYQFPSLADQIQETDKYKAESNDIKWIIISRCLDVHSVFYEYNRDILEQLTKDKAALITMIQRFNDNPAAHSIGRFPEETASAIRGNALGLHAARLSGGVMAVIHERTWDKAAAQYSGDVKPVGLTEAQKQQLKKDYGEFIKVGSDFRHNHILYTQLLKQFKVKISVVKTKATDHKESVTIRNNQVAAASAGIAAANLTPALSNTPVKTAAPLSPETVRPLLTNHDTIQAQLDKLVDEANTQLQKEEINHQRKELNDLIKYLSTQPYANNPIYQTIVQNILNKCIELFRLKNQIDAYQPAADGKDPVSVAATPKLERTSPLVQTPKLTVAPTSAFIAVKKVK